MPDFSFAWQFKSRIFACEELVKSLIASIDEVPYYDHKGNFVRLYTVGERTGREPDPDHPRGGQKVFLLLDGDDIVDVVSYFIGNELFNSLYRTHMIRLRSLESAQYELRLARLNYSQWKRARGYTKGL